MTFFSQEEVFLLFFIIGVIIGIIFDFFRVLRKAFKTSDKITFIEDVIFLIITSNLIIYSIIKINNGEIRFFIFLGIFFGILIYSLTISNLYVIILYEFIKVIKRIVTFTNRLFFSVLKIIYSKIKNSGDT